MNSAVLSREIKLKGLHYCVTNTTFEHCIDIIARMIQQYGGKMSEQQNQTLTKDEPALK